MIDARDPFRRPDEAPLVFELVSSRWFIAATWLMVLLGIVLIGLGTSASTVRGGGLLPWIAVASGLLAPAAMWSSRATYTIPGGRGELRVYDDRVELIDGRGPAVVSAADLRVHVVEHRARIVAVPGATVRTDRHLVFATSGRQITLSRRVFASDEAFVAAGRALTEMAVRAAAARATTLREADDGIPPEHAAQIESLFSELFRRSNDVAR